MNYSSLYLYVLLAIVQGYLLGSISFSYLAGKILRGINLREHGSGNLGASNTFRILGPAPGIVVLALDTLKGYLAVEVALQLGQSASLQGETLITLGIMGGLAAFIGHLYPVFHGLKGGKGVATSLGIFLNLAPKAILVAFAVWLVIFLITRYISLGSILAALSLPIFMLIQKYSLNQPISQTLLWFTVTTGLLVIIKHHGNIKRLFSGTESKFQWKKKQSSLQPPASGSSGQWP